MGGEKLGLKLNSAQLGLEDWTKLVDIGTIVSRMKTEINYKSLDGA